MSALALKTLISKLSQNKHAVLIFAINQISNQIFIYDLIRSMVIFTLY